MLRSLSKYNKYNKYSKYNNFIVSKIKSGLNPTNNGKFRKSILISSINGNNQIRNYSQDLDKYVYNEPDFFSYYLKVFASMGILCSPFFILSNDFSLTMILKDSLIWCSWPSLGVTRLRFFEFS